MSWLKKIYPEEYITNYVSFEEDFLKYVDNKYIANIERYRMTGANLDIGTFIHVDKMSSIGSELAKRELATKNKDDKWYCIHPSIANDYMFYLATLLGKEINSQPITDTVESFNLSVPFGTQIQRNKLGREQLRKEILENVFPVPLDIENAKELYKFKNKHEEKLKSFRRCIEKELLKIDMASPNFKDELKHELLLYIEDEKKSISSNMKVNWKHIVGASFLSIASDGLGLADGLFSNNVLAVGSSIGSIADLVREKISDTISSRQEALNNPMAYAFLVEKKVF